MDSTRRQKYLDEVPLTSLESESSENLKSKKIESSSSDDVKLTSDESYENEGEDLAPNFDRLFKNKQKENKDLKNSTLQKNDVIPTVSVAKDSHSLLDNTTAEIGTEAKHDTRTTRKFNKKVGEIIPQSALTENAIDTPIKRSARIRAAIVNSSQINTESVHTEEPSIKSARRGRPKKTEILKDTPLRQTLLSAIVTSTPQPNSYKIATLNETPSLREPEMTADISAVRNDYEKGLSRKNARLVKEKPAVHSSTHARRPHKPAQNLTVTINDVNESEVIVDMASENNVSSRPRGRPAKNKTITISQQVPLDEDKGKKPAAKRGRPPKESDLKETHTTTRRNKAPSVESNKDVKESDDYLAHVEKPSAFKNKNQNSEETGNISDFVEVKEKRTTTRRNKAALVEPNKDVKESVETNTNESTDHVQVKEKRTTTRRNKANFVQPNEDVTEKSEHKKDLKNSDDNSTDVEKSSITEKPKADSAAVGRRGRKAAKTFVEEKEEDLKVQANSKGGTKRKAATSTKTSSETIDVETEPVKKTRSKRADIKETDEEDESVEANRKGGTKRKAATSTKTSSETIDFETEPAKKTRSKRADIKETDEEEESAETNRKGDTKRKAATTTKRSSETIDVETEPAKKTRSKRATATKPQAVQESEPAQRSTRKRVLT